MNTINAKITPKNTINATLSDANSVINANVTTAQRVIIPADWSKVTNKPFETLDENTLSVSDGVLTVIGGGSGGGDVTSVNGKTGRVVLNASDVGALADNTTIPSKTSDLTNDSNFVVDSNYTHIDNNYSDTDKTKLDGLENYSLPTASTTTLGGVKVDGTTVTISNGVISSVGGGSGNVASVNGKTGAVTLDKDDVGLGNVNNTSDDAKPISAATQTALDGKSATDHTHTKSDITDFPASMPASDVYDWAKASSKPTYTASEVGALPDTTTIPTVTNDLTDTLKEQYDTAYTHSQSTHAPSNAQKNVQSDWGETNTSADGYINNKPEIPSEYTLPTASADTLGGVKIGSGITITDGVISASGGSGNSQYIFIKYSDVEPTQDSDMTDTPSDYKGTYIGTSTTAPTTYNSYTWEKVKGEKGDTGDTGSNGADGVSPTVAINTNTDTEYKLDITDSTGTITTPNLKGANGSSSTTLSSELTLTVTDWDSTAKTQTITATVDTDKLNTPLPTTTSLKEYASCGIYLSAENSTGYTFTCDTIPENALTLKIKSEEVTE